MGATGAGAGRASGAGVAAVMMWAAGASSTAGAKGFLYSDSTVTSWTAVG